MRKLFAFGAALAIASSAYAAPNIAQTAQKGSLLVAPDIDVRPGVTTIVRMQNDANFAVDVKCYYMDKDKKRNDFVFRLTKGQPIWFDAASGAGTIAANPFPDGFGAGMLVCFAVDETEQGAIRWNHLSMTVTVINFDGGQAYEYNAWAFFARNGSEGTVHDAPVDGGLGRQLTLNSTATGRQYDGCPRQLIGQFSPEGAELALDAGTVTFGTTRLVLVNCNMDLRQNYRRYDTKYTFDVWNENEIKFTGAHDCANGWHETNLTNVKAEGDNFTLGDLKTPAARYRVEGIDDNSVCKLPTTAPYTGTNNVGALGVQATNISLAGGEATVGTTLTAVGSRNGFVRWDPAGVIEEGTIK
jgi:hypothetical protein